MNFYNIKDDYIAYIKKYEPKVPENKCETRPYVGVVVRIDDICYYAPFSSPKLKHQKMKNSKDFRKINKGIYGAINFNNMIPVPEEALIPLEIAKIPDLKYRRLLQEQYSYVSEDWESIQKTAESLRLILTAPDKELKAHERQIKKRSCNLILLEAVYRGYICSE